MIGWRFETRFNDIFNEGGAFFDGEGWCGRMKGGLMNGLQ
jgi:hypothetical protein